MVSYDYSERKPNENKFQELLLEHYYYSFPTKAERTGTFFQTTHVGTA